MVNLVEHSCPNCGKIFFESPKNICPYCSEGMERNKFREDVRQRISNIRVRWVRSGGKEAGRLIPQQPDSTASNN